MATTNPNRPSILAGTAAALSAPLAAVPALASADAPLDADLDLLALGREFTVTAARHDALVAERCRLCDLWVDRVPDFPDAVMKTERDAELHLCGSHRVGEDYGEEAIERFRSHPRTVPVDHPAPAEKGYNLDDRIVRREPSAEAQARADAIVAAWDAYQAERDRLRVETGLERAEEACADAEADLDDLVERIVTTPATTTAGLLVKTSVVRWGHLGEIDIGRRHPPDKRAAFSIVRDLLALAGEAAHV